MIDGANEGCSGITAASANHERVNQHEEIAHLNRAVRESDTFFWVAAYVAARACLWNNCPATIIYTCTPVASILQLSDKEILDIRI